VGDYAASIGTTGYDYTVVLPNSPPLKNNGVFQAVTGTRLAEIRSKSSTLLIGEKHVPRGMEGQPPWDCGIWDGHNMGCSNRSAGPDFPMAVAVEDMSWKFGSRHPTVCQFVFCDGSVRAIQKTINPVTFGMLAQRDNEQVIPEY
jgi:prepilin-type processing-associated H-X9-DG protein